MATKKNQENAQAEELPFEARMLRLQEIVDTLEQGEISLADSVILYKEGLAHTKLCRESLEKAHHEIKILTQGSDGELTFEDFSLESD